MISKSNDKDEEDSDQDCFSLYEGILLSIMYTVLTGLYLTASSTIQYIFVGFITILLLSQHTSILNK